jgi:hypothetical protein
MRNASRHARAQQRHQQEPIMTATSRRQALRLASALTVATGLASVGRLAHASDRQGKLAVMSMVGHDITLVQSSFQIGTRMPTRRESVPMGSGLLDQRATLALDKQARQFVPADKIVLMSAQGQMWSELQRDALAGEAGMKDMIATVTDVARRGGCSHALALIKHRGLARIRLLHESIGHGMLEGLGFYIDTAINTVKEDSREQGIGILAPYAYMKLLYIDADKVSLIRSEVTEASLGIAPEMGDMRHPWEALDADQKTRFLTNLIEEELARLVPKVMKPS